MRVFLNADIAATALPCYLLGVGLQPPLTLPLLLLSTFSLIRVRTLVTSILLCGAFAVVLSSGPAMAADFRALAGLQGVPPFPLPDEVLDRSACPPRHVWRDLLPLLFTARRLADAVSISSSSTLKLPIVLNPRPDTSP
jgi:hypothetical protein